MKIVKVLVCLGICALEISASAGALLQIKGKLTSITSQQYVVETPHTIYYIRKSGVDSNQAKLLDRTEVDVMLTVPMQAVENAKSKSPADTSSH